MSKFNVVVFFALFGAELLSGCAPDSQILVVSTPVPPTGDTPPQLEARIPVSVENEQIRGFFIRRRHIYVILNLNNEEYSLAIAGVVCKPGTEVRVLRAITEALAYRWNIAPASPISNGEGAIQIEVEYRVGIATRMLKETLNQAIIVE